jgi:hypothetical protein
VLILNETCLHHILDEFDVIIASDIDWQRHGGK